MRTVLPLAALALALGSSQAVTIEPVVDTSPGTTVTFEMVPLPGGKYQRGSTAKEAGRNDDEGAAHQVTVGPFLIGRREVTWDEFDAFFYRERQRLPPGQKPDGADAITGPTPPYADESHDFGKGKQPVMSITHHAASEYARWLSTKTGRKYRLPTEAEWEYACRAGATTAYSFGADATDLGAYAWFERNADGRPHPVGQKQPNAWGLYDVHGNVAEWTAVDPGKELDPPVARGGSWDDDPADLRCAARRSSSEEWNRRDPQMPKSMWWLTDGTFVGFRIVRDP